MMTAFQKQRAEEAILEAGRVTCSFVSESLAREIVQGLEDQGLVLIRESDLANRIQDARCMA